jgi:hypothetical protein
VPFNYEKINISLNNMTVEISGVSTLNADSIISLEQSYAKVWLSIVSV